MTRQDTGPVGSSFVTSVEKVLGTSHNDDLVGDDRSNRLRGMGGDDYLAGEGGKDRLLAGLGGDLIMGGLGDDRLVGGPGIDALNGEAGADVCRTGEMLEDCQVRPPDSARAHPVTLSGTGFRDREAPPCGRRRVSGRG